MNNHTYTRLHFCFIAAFTVSCGLSLSASAGDVIKLAAHNFTVPIAKSGTTSVINDRYVSYYVSGSLSGTFQGRVQDSLADLKSNEYASASGSYSGYMYSYLRHWYWTWSFYWQCIHVWRWNIWVPVWYPVYTYWDQLTSIGHITQHRITGWSNSELFFKSGGTATTGKSANDWDADTLDLPDYSNFLKPAVADINTYMRDQLPSEISSYLSSFVEADRSVIKNAYNSYKQYFSSLYKPLGDSAAHPNIIMLLADDLDELTLQTLLDNGYMSNLKTHLLERGVRFSQSFVTNAICCPSRATYLTGQYSHNHGILAVTRSGDRKGISYWLTDDGKTTDCERNTLPVWLQNAGYYTGHIGKYLNGYGQDTDETYIPPGYNDWHGAVDPYTYKMYGTRINHNGTAQDYGETEADYSTDVLSNLADSFIRETHNSRPDQPFALTLTPTAPHIEFGYEEYGAADTSFQTIRPAPRHAYLADDNETNGEMPSISFKSSVFEMNLSEKLIKIVKMGLFDAEKRDNTNSQFKDRLAAMLAVDDMIGKIARALQETGQYENTVIIFAGDNGWFYAEHGLSGKSWAYEEAVRVPLIIASPLHSGRGSSDKVVINTDWAVTIAELAHATPLRAVDGRSLVSLLGNPQGSTWQRRRFFVESYLAGAADTKNAYSLPNTYSAVREIDGASNFLFVNYVSASEYLFGHSVWKEYYDLNVDPTEEHGSGGSDITAMKNENGQLLPLSSVKFANGAAHCQTLCAGSECRNMEDMSSDTTVGTSHLSCP